MFKRSLENIPSVIKNFLLRALLIFVLWKLVYHNFLFKIRIPDDQLTHITTVYTTKLLQLTYTNNVFDIVPQSLPNPKENILMNNKKVIAIADGCNGLELFVLYIGFLLAFYTNAKRVLLFGVLGIVIIFIANILRCYGIAMLNIRSATITEIAHHYVFKIIIYAIMFLLWVRYTNFNKQENE